MATIIPFRRPSGGRRPSGKKSPSPAKILFFPGVRYERTGAQGLPQQPARPNRKRRESAD